MRANLSIRAASTLGLTLSLICTNAQTNYVQMEQVQGSPLNISYRTDSEDKEIDGSPFLIDEWKEIKITKIDGLNLIASEAKYDIYAGFLIARISNQLYSIDSKEISHFIIGDRKFIGSSYDSRSYGFFEVLYKSPKVILLKQYRCSLKKGRPSNGIMEGTNDSYILYVRYYIKKTEENSKPLELKVGRKSLTLKSSKYPQLSNYLRGLNSDFRDESILIEALSNFE